MANELSKVVVSAEVVLKIVEYVNTHGPTSIHRIKELIETWNKKIITNSDWELLKDLWDKTPEDFLEEAKARSNK
jgi:predicted nucleic acid-binding protein